MKVPPVRSNLMWWAGIAVMTASFVTCVSNAEPQTQVVIIVASLVCFERAW